MKPETKYFISMALVGTLIALVTNYFVQGNLYYSGSQNAQRKRLEIIEENYITKDDAKEFVITQAKDIIYASDTPHFAATNRAIIEELKIGLRKLEAHHAPYKSWRNE